jgi:hypothetical protein
VRVCVSVSVQIYRSPPPIILSVTLRESGAVEGASERMTLLGEPPPSPPLVVVKAAVLSDFSCAEI